jgi:hypothetical protein
VSDRSSSSSSTVLADLAATLHQLAVVATNSKPARLDEAEALLQEALRLEMLSVVDPHVRTPYPVEQWAVRVLPRGTHAQLSQWPSAPG